MHQADLANEESFQWIEDPSMFRTITESVAYANTRTRSLKRHFIHDGLLIGWAILGRSSKSNHARQFARRIFYVKSHHLQANGVAVSNTFHHDFVIGKSFINTI